MSSNMCLAKPGNGEVWLANLNPGGGIEQGKMQPVLIVQGQALLDANHPSTLVVAADDKPDE